MWACPCCRASLLGFPKWPLSSHCSAACQTPGGGGGWKEAGHRNVTQSGAVREGEAGEPLVRLPVPAWSVGAVGHVMAVRVCK